MEIFGMGITEILFILVIVLIVFGPNDLVKNSREIGKFLRDIVTSDTWRAFTRTSREIRNIPNRLMREAGLDEIENEARNLSRDIRQSTNFNNIPPASGRSVNPENARSQPRSFDENRIAPSMMDTPPTIIPTPPDEENNADDQDKKENNETHP